MGTLRTSAITVLIARIWIAVLAALMLTGCTGFGGGAFNSTSSKALSIDLNADVEAIANEISKFDANSASSSAAKSLQDYVELSENNESILDSIEITVKKFKDDIKLAWNELPAEDTETSPSRDKYLNWVQGYETWVYYQRESQKLGSACIVTSQTKEDFELCTLNNFNRTMEFERLSREDLSAAIQDIRDWRDSIGASNG